MKLKFSSRRRAESSAVGTECHSVSSSRQETESGRVSTICLDSSLDAIKALGRFIILQGLSH